MKVIQSEKIETPYGERLYVFAAGDMADEDQFGPDDYYGWIHVGGYATQGYVIDTSRSDVKVYPLIVTCTGMQKGKEIQPQTWRVGFDEKKWKYAVPKELNRGY